MVKAFITLISTTISGGTPANRFHKSGTQVRVVTTGPQFDNYMWCAKNITAEFEKRTKVNLGFIFELKRNFICRPTNKLLKTSLIL
jgi:hypothetical protein